MKRVMTLIARRMTTLRTIVMVGSVVVAYLCIGCVGEGRNKGEGVEGGGEVMPVQKTGFEILSPTNGAIVSLLSGGQKKWLTMPREDRVAAFAAGKQRLAMVREGDRPQGVRFAWRLNDPVMKDPVYSFRLFRDGMCIYAAETKEPHLDFENLEVAREYQWKVHVLQKGVTNFWQESGRFRTEDFAPRMLHIAGVPNFRDLGGRIGLDNRRIRQGMVYRAAGLNDNAADVFYTKEERLEMDPLLAGKPEELAKPVLKGREPGKNRLTDEGKKFLTKTLCIRSDIDLRNDKECYGMTGSPMGEEVKWFHYSSGAYQEMASRGGKEAFAKVFRVFLDARNYPIVFHCIAGQDRTGAVAFILNGLLGVSEEELWIDWEVTGFTNSDLDFRHENRFRYLLEVFEPLPGETMNEKIASYVRSIGFTDEDIERFRSIMLE